MVGMDWRARRRYWARLLVVGGGGVLISVVAYLYSAALERRVQAGEFQRLAHVQFRNAQDLLDHSAQLLLAFRGLFMATETVEREEFARFAREMLPSYPEVLAVHWALRVPHDERGAFECDLLPFQERRLGIFDVSADARLPVPAPAREEYLPIWYTEPFEAHRRVLGLDTLARPYNREVARDSARLGVQRTTPVFPLLQEPDGPLAVAIYQPVYRKGLPLATDEQRQQALEGYLILMLRPSVLLKALSFERLAMEVRLYDLQDGQPVAIHPRGAVPREPGERVVRYPLAVPGRQWLIEFVAPQGFGGLSASIQPLLPMLALLALTLVLLLFLERSHRGAIALERLNDELLCRQRELDALAYYDALTGLPNRLLLFDRIHMALGLQRRQGGRLAVCVLDLDGFKAVNDRFGHQAGDLLLKDVAQRMLAVLRPSDTVARLGGDEFVVVLSGANDAPALDGILQRLLDRLSRPIELGAGQPAVSVSASVGVAFAGEHSDANGLIREADLAMYEAKRAGKGCYRIFGAGRAAGL
ncbi:diguanylate cyclase (GGDEF) domain-containing protein [Azotobacter beijerinckii]|uniref:Diguanylate cyclase (GGDEF) domain-containing protein n=2 Tax=Azotobacter beijerinckii TaxID=170623 RepID=A0A1H6U6F5_9GAMM|nr:diguanylate cyclase (GGDEF) domain-containing protein [Azotobacter beijerinckii]